MIMAYRQGFISNNYKMLKNHNILLIKLTFGKSIMQEVNFQTIHSIKRIILAKNSLYHDFKKCLNCWLPLINAYITCLASLLELSL